MLYEDGVGPYYYRYSAIMGLIFWGHRRCTQVHSPAGGDRGEGLCFLRVLQRHCMQIHLFLPLNFPSVSPLGVGDGETVNAIVGDLGGNGVAVADETMSEKRQSASERVSNKATMDWIILTENIRSKMWMEKERERESRMGKKDESTYDVDGLCTYSVQKNRKYRCGVTGDLFRAPFTSMSERDKYEYVLTIKRVVDVVLLPVRVGESAFYYLRTRVYLSQGERPGWLISGTATSSWSQERLRVSHDDFCAYN